MLKHIFFVVAALSVVSLAFTGSSSCGSGSTGGGAGGGSGGGSGGSGGGAGDPDLTCAASPPATTFTKVYTDVFPSCNTCHLSNSADGSQSYGLYDTQANAYLQVNKISVYAGSARMLKVVDPNHPENSTMWLKVIAHPKSPGGLSIGNAMPNGLTPISATLKQTLKDWICSGAAM